jgi:carbonic anhydrase
MITIEVVRTPGDAQIAATLAREMIAWMYERYPDYHENLGNYLRVQNIDHQLANLLTVFAPPSAACLLARIAGEPAGIVMLKPHVSGACEMNRMFVRPAFRGHGVGQALAARLIERARELGYSRMVLSAGPDHHEAIPLYTKLGFSRDTTLPDTGAGDDEVRMALSL